VCFLAPVRAALPLPQPSSDLECDATPFGRSLSIGGDDEFIEFYDYPSWVTEDSNAVWELSDEPGEVFERWASSSSNEDSTLLKAIRTDLDGDGKDEVVTAVRLNEPGENQGDLRLHVWLR